MTEQNTIRTKEFANGNVEYVYLEDEDLICKTTKMKVVAKITIEPKNNHTINAERYIKNMISKEPTRMTYEKLPDGTFVICDLSPYSLDLAYKREETN